MGSDPDPKRRILGSVLGGAVGDALGAPIEFMSLEQIRQKFGPEGLSTYSEAYGRVGAITDDTQMTLWTAEGLLRAQSRFKDSGLWAPIPMIHNAYYRWLHSQGVPWKEIPSDLPEADGWLMQQEFLHARRAPGRTCWEALSRGNANNDSKGCGGVMRVAPIGLVANEPFDLATKAAALTHGHPTGGLAAGAFAEILARVINGATLDDAIGPSLEVLSRHEHHEETTNAINAAVSSARSDEPTPEAVERLGQGWIAEEALALSLFCALTAKDFRGGLLLSVNHGGDCDSTGSITGNFLGALHGAEAVPQELLRELEGRDVIEQVAEDLVSYMLAGEEIDTARYPTW